MKRNHYKTVKYICKSLVFALTFFTIPLVAQETADVNIVANNPLSGSLAQLADRVRFDITTTFVQPKEVALEITIDGISGDAEGITASNELASLGETITLNNGLNSFTYAMFSGPEYEGYSIEGLEYDASPVQKALIEDYRILPAGSYIICVKVLDPITALEIPKSTNTNNCQVFDITLYDAPRITIPNDPGQVVSVTATPDNSMYFHWNVSTTAPADYTLTIRRFADFNQLAQYNEAGRPQDMFDGLELVGQIETNMREYNTIQDDIILEARSYYTCQVVVQSTGVNFLNAGRSNTPLFTYGAAASNACQSPSYNAQIVFPQSGDTIPFMHIPQMVMVDPVCDELMEAYTELVTGSSASSQHRVDKNRNWTNVGGPYNFLYDHLQQHVPSNLSYWLPNREIAGYLLLDDLTQTPYSYTRGENYKTSGLIKLKHRNPTNGNIQQEIIQLNNLVTDGFTVGMPKPMLRFPEHNITSSPGNIAFTFNTGENPHAPLPPYKLISITNDTRVMTNLAVYEKCIFQVSRTDQFNQADIVFSQLKKIQAEGINVNTNYDYDNPNKQNWNYGNDYFGNREYDYQTFMEKVYRDFDVEIPLVDEGTYYWRVVWLKDPDAINVTDPHQSIDVTSSMIYHSSSTRILNIGSSSGLHEIVCTPMDDLPDDPVEGEESECVSSAIPVEITNTNFNENVVQGDVVKIGMFDLMLTDITQSEIGHSVSGQGKVQIQFLNNAWINVELNSIKVNTDNQVLSGSISPIKDQDFELIESDADGLKALGMSDAEASALSNSLHGGGKLLSLLASESTLNLPIGIDKEIAGEQFTLGIVDFNITPNEPATLKAVFNTDLDFLEVPNALLSLGAELQFHPEGLASDGKMYRPSNVEIPIDNGNSFIIKGSQDEDDIEKICYVQWDCTGFKCLNLAASMKFSREVLLPENSDGTVGPGNVKFDIFGKLCSESNYIFGIDGAPFQIPGVDGWTFNPTSNLFVDLSDLENIPDFDSNKPEGYEHASFDFEDDQTTEEKENQSNTWKGFYLGALELKAPNDFITSGDERISFGINNLIIDETGVSLKFLIEDVVGIEEGNIEDFKFSLDSIYMNIVQNSFRDAGFAGDFGIPYTKKNEYLHYNAVFQQETVEGDEEADEGEETSSNFVLTVKPKENLTIPMLLGSAKVDESSKIEISIGDNTFINVDLVASLDIGNEFMSEEDRSRMPSTVKMPSVRIEHLQYHSDFGFKVEKFDYTLASPQKSMSGFPISLESISISAGKTPSINIEPKIVLIDGDEEGFSASVGIDIVTKIEDGHIEIDGLQLTKVVIDLETSGLDLKGELEFYEEDVVEGVRGSLLLDLNMGEGGASGGFKAMLNADFGSYKEESATVYNTEDWYSYFFVDGIVVLSPGLTIFSGLDLYGLGGGFAKNMKRTSALPTGAEQVWSEDESTPAKSKQNYEPEFGTIGLNFLAILGSTQDKGEKYNLDLELGAEFSSSGGLLKFEFNGSFRVMDGEIKLDNIGTLGEAPIGGFLRLSYNNPIDGEEHFVGNLLVKVNIEETLTGLGTDEADIPEGFVLGPGENFNNAMVWASMYVGPDKWFYYMGTPENRGGLALKLPGSDEPLVRVDAYLMIGTEIPDQIPSPSDAFLRIFNDGSPSQRFDSTDGPLSDLLEGAPRPPLLAGVGSGFAFGSSLELHLDARTPGLGFYASVDVAAGFDLNITHSTSRTCAETGDAPGQNGWYATGQFYAGIEGEIGMFVDLWFIEGEFPILNAMAAMILRGGAPNPVWAEGRARIRYSILDGLFEGNHTFHAVIGDKCSPSSGNPFADIDIIQDLQPEGSTSVFATPEAAFAVKMNKVFEIPVYDDITGDPLSPRRIKAVVETFECYPKNSDTAVPRQKKYLDGGYIYRITPNDVLNPNSDYTSLVTVKAKEYFPSQGWKFIRDDDTGSDFTQSMTKDFKTGAAPNELLVRNIKLSYPFHNQNNFLKKETRNNKGFITLAQGRPGLLSEDVNVGGIQNFSNDKAKFYARFIPEGGLDTIMTPLTISSNKRILEFRVDQLENDKIYGLQIVKVFPKSLQDIAFEDMMNNSQALNYQISDLDINYGESTIQSSQIRTIKLPGDQAFAPREHILYNYYFKTSLFDRFVKKVNVSISEEYKQDGSLGDWFELSVQLNEPFEWCDGKGFKATPGDYDAQKWIKPMIRFDIQEDYDGEEFAGNFWPGTTQNSYIRSKVSTHVRIPESYFYSLKYAVNNYNDIPISIKPYKLAATYDYDNMVMWKQGNYYLDRLSQNDIESAFTFSLNPALTNIENHLDVNNTTNNGINNDITNTGINLNIGNPFGSSSTGNSGAASTTTGFGGLFFGGGTPLFIDIYPKIRYVLPMYGISQMREMQRNLLAFINQDVQLAPLVTTKLINILSQEYITAYNQCALHLFKDPDYYMKLNRGTHSFIMHYQFPNKNGVGYTKGSGREVKWTY